MADAIITDVIRDILERSTVSGDRLVLPPEQLDRATYKAVNDAIANLGGKWNRSARAHLFSRDPREAIASALESGVSPDEKKRLQRFYTPAHVAARVVELACVSGARVLEPSAGEGALADECRAAGALIVDCIEIDFAAVEVLRSKGYSTAERDFLQMSPESNHYYDRIVMNPPFTKSQDVKHVEHALQFLRPGGCLVAVMSGNITRAPFERLVEGRAHRIEHVPAGAFKESGTNVATVIVAIEVAA